MFRKTRRAEKSMAPQEAEALLRSCTNGVLAVQGDDGYPYAVPVSYAYADGKIYFHGAVEGYKADAISKCDKVSFCVIGADDVQPEDFNTYYSSVIIFGRAAILEDDKDKQRCLECLTEKYSSEFFEKGLEYIKKAWGRTNAFAISVEHMTGKSGIPKK